PREMASSPAQDHDDPTTWDFVGNENPILQVVWLLTQPIAQLGMGLDYDEIFAPVIEQIKDQAGICDELVSRKEGGPENRYTSGVQYKSDDDPNEVLNAILGTCDGFCCENGDGTFTLKAGKWDDEDFEVLIRDKHIISNV